MRKTILYSVLTALVLTGMYSCDLETSDNGDLDGNWQLLQADTVATGGVKNMKGAQIFYAVQSRLISVRAVNLPGTSGGYIFHFEQTADSLLLKTAANDGQPMYEVTQLQPFGLNKAEEHFKIITLNADKMVLQSDLLKLSFRKY